jgi:hypothetical protein
MDASTNVHKGGNVSQSDLQTGVVCLRYFDFPSRLNKSLSWTARSDSRHESQRKIERRLELRALLRMFCVRKVPSQGHPGRWHGPVARPSPCVDFRVVIVSQSDLPERKNSLSLPKTPKALKSLANYPAGPYCFRHARKHVGALMLARLSVSQPCEIEARGHCTSSTDWRSCAASLRAVLDSPPSIGFCGSGFIGRGRVASK